MSHAQNDVFTEALLEQALESAMECPRCKELALVRLPFAPQVDQAGRTFVEYECVECGHYETGAA